MKILKVIRAVEWWEYKFPPILAGSYFVLTQTSASLETVLLLFSLVLASLIAGAVYVSVLNDVTDIQEDALAGKQNRMSGYSALQRGLLLILSLLIATCFCWLLRQYKSALAFYILSYLAFTLYSAPPFRLKTKGLAGIFADAAGSQLLPTLFAAALMASYLDFHLSTYQYLLLGAWSFCLGVRGILWHQFHDLDNDIKSGTYTWVQSLSNRKTRFLGRCILFVEISAISMLIIEFNQFVCFLSLLVYGLYLLLWRKKSGVQIIMLRYHQTHFTILMNEYYQVFLPITLLLVLSIHNPSFIYLLIIHLLVFPIGLTRVFKNTFSGLKTQTNA
jgi:1,4-dihydroxy-2-naphthoate octaprenyltransferase